MKLKLRFKKITIMIIPEGNKSVRRLHVPRILVNAIAASAAVLILASIYFQVEHLHITRTAEQLRSDLKLTKDTLAQTNLDKDRTIDQLQNKVVNLSDQAEQMKSKMDELQKLEQELKGTASTAKSGDSGGKQALASGHAATDGDGQDSSAPAIGGEFTSVTSSEIMALSDQTSDLMSKLTEQISQAEEGLSEAKKAAAEKQRQLDRTPNIFPTDSHLVTSGFGYRIDPFTGEASLHTGIDFGANTGEPVYAAASGVVVFTGYDSAHGNNIILSHGNGLKTRYLHLSKILVDDGSPIKKGQLIGKVGNTGRSTGPHLHYEVWKNNTPINPKPYLPN